MNAGQCASAVEVCETHLALQIRPTKRTTNSIRKPEINGSRANRGSKYRRMKDGRLRLVGFGAAKYAGAGCSRRPAVFVPRKQAEEDNNLYYRRVMIFTGRTNAQKILIIIYQLMPLRLLFL